MVVSVTVKPQGRSISVAKGLPFTFTFGDKTTQSISIRDVKKAVRAKYPKFRVSRQKLSIENSKAALADDTSIATAFGPSLAGKENPEVVLYVKDLGPQVSWRTVFLVEYLGPLLIHPLVYHFPKIFYRQSFEHSQVQTVTYALVMAHFFKRELESLFVHRFSHATMPLRNIFKNSFHYHILSGVLLAGGVYGPWYSAPSIKNLSRSQPASIIGFTILFIIAEYLNFSSHMTLRNLRPAGSRARGIPRGGLFEWVSCPNYLTETIAWAAIAGLTRSIPAFIFATVSAVQMGIWGIKKHKAYRREFGDKYPRGRKVMIPYLF